MIAIICGTQMACLGMAEWLALLVKEHDFVKNVPWGSQHLHVLPIFRRTKLPYKTENTKNGTIY